MTNSTHFSPKHRFCILFYCTTLMEGTVIIDQQTSIAGIDSKYNPVLLGVFGVLHILAVFTGYRFYFGQMEVATAWPGSGLFMGALLITRPRQWLYIVPTACLSQGLVDFFLFDKTLINTFLFALNNPLECIAGALIVRWFCGGVPDLGKMRDVVALAFLGALLSTIASTIGGSILVVWYSDADYWSVFQVWWFADALGVLTTAPLVLAVARYRHDIASITPKRAVELAIVFACMIAAIHLIFSTQVSGFPFALNAPYILMPFLLYFAARFPGTIMACALLISSFLIITYSDFGMGPLRNDTVTLQDNVLNLQLFLTVNVLTNLVLFAGLHERNRAYAERHDLERQLNQSQKLDSLGTLAGGIAHDFNNVLQTIISYCSLAQRENNGQNKDIQAHLEVIERAGHSGAQVVQQILTFSRPSDVDLRPIQLANPVNEVIKYLRSSIPANIHLACQIDNSLPLAPASATQIQQIVTNLCANAVHAMGERRGCMEIKLDSEVLEQSLTTTTTSLAPGHYVVLTVRDEGVGIHPEDMDRIFDPFFTTKGVGKGTGLGMTMVRSIVQAHGGGLSIDSAVSQGTTMRVYFPAILDSQPKEQVTPQTEMSETTFSGEMLIVDDDDDIARAVAMALLQRGFATEVVTDPQKAEALLRSNPERFDLALLDYTMPGLTGFELAERIREINPELPVIVMSGILDDNLLRKSAEFNVSEMIRKPYTLAHLYDVVGRVLEKSK